MIAMNDDDTPIKEIHNKPCIYCGATVLFLKDSDFKKDGKSYQVRECESCESNNLTENEDV